MLLQKAGAPARSRPAVLSRTNVVDLMDIRQRSLDAERLAGKTVRRSVVPRGSAAPELRGPFNLPACLPSAQSTGSSRQVRRHSLARLSFVPPHRELALVDPVAR